MRYLLLVLLCAFNLSAHAQWWRVGFLKRKPLPPITQPRSMKRLPKYSIVKTPMLSNTVPRSAYNLEMCEKAVIKQAQHHMRYREYAIASYDFSELAELYVLENRLSEAKWYYLQSILLSKRQGDQQHTIKNLISLGMIKADLGDLRQAQEDLAEARSIALATGRKADVAMIDTKIAYVKNNKVWLSKSELRYAEAVEASGKLK